MPWQSRVKKWLQNKLIIKLKINDMKNLKVPSKVL